MKKIYFLFLMALLPLVASAETLEINGINYDVNPEAKTAKVISKSSGSYSGMIVIPKTVSFKNIKCKVTSIGSYAFEHCSGLTSVTIPSTVTSIGYSVFSGCSSLSFITIPSSVTSIGSDAFYGTPWYNNKPVGVVYAGKVLYCYKGDMPKGTKLSIKDGTLGIANDAFKYCIGLTSVTIPSTVTSIGAYAFSNCSNLKSATIGNSVTSIGDYAFHECSGLTSVKIPNSVSSIGSHAFYNCSGLKSATIGNSVTDIGDYAFYNCSGLTSVKIPNSVSSIGSHAFYYCSGLKSATFGNSVTSIGSYAFEFCSGLTSVIIPNSVTDIGDYAFYGCSGLKSATIGNSVTYIGSYAFGCSGLTSVIIPNSVSSIGSYAFYNCSGLKSAIIGNRVARIEDYTFYGCNSLATVMLGYGIIYIGDYSFANCGQLTDFYCFASNKPNCIHCTYNNIGYTSFSNSYINYATLHVLARIVEAYKASAPWSEFKDIVAIETVKVKLNKTKVTLDKGETVTLKATVYPTSLTDKSVTWKSSNTKVATVTSSGKVMGIGAGTATITCTFEITGEKATCNVTVNGTVTLNKTEAYLEKGKTMTLKATLTPTDLSDKSVTWKSSDKSIATVSSSGEVKGVKYGTVTITCTSKATGESATCKVTVGKVVINMTEFTLKKSRAVTLIATVYPTSLTDKSVTWKSSNKKVATVTSEGKVKGIAAGTATITCTSVATGLKGTCTVTVLSTSGGRSSEGDGEDVTGIEIIDEAPAPAEPYDVYDLSGRKVRHQVTSLDGLPAGIYIVNGKKILNK